MSYAYASDTVGLDNARDAVSKMMEAKQNLSVTKEKISNCYTKIDNAWEANGQVKKEWVEDCQRNIKDLEHLLEAISQTIGMANNYINEEEMITDRSAR